MRRTRALVSVGVAWGGIALVGSLINHVTEAAVIGVVLPLLVVVLIFSTLTLIAFFFLVISLARRVFRQPPSAFSEMSLKIYSTAMKSAISLVGMLGLVIFLLFFFTSLLVAYTS